jgi:hypothetical protein
LLAAVLLLLLPLHPAQYQDHGMLLLLLAAL